MSDVLEWQRSRDPSRVLKAIATLVVGGIWVAMLVSFVFDDRPTGQMLAQRMVCDKAMEAVMTSRDLVEIERGGVLLIAIGCDVRRRIGPDGRFKPLSEPQQE